MFRQLLSVVLCISIFLYAYGCSSSRAVSTDTYLKDPTKGIEKLVLLDGSVIEFDNTLGRLGVLKNEEIVGFTKGDGSVVRVPVSKIQAIYYSETDAVQSVLLGGGILMGVYIIAGAAVMIYLITAFM